MAFKILNILCRLIKEKYPGVGDYNSNFATLAC